MGTTSKRGPDGETYHYALTDYLKRGKLYGARDNGGNGVIVYYGSPLGYPMGDSVLQVHRDNIADLIALLKAVESHK